MDPRDGRDSPKASLFDSEPALGSLNDEEKDPLLAPLEHKSRRACEAEAFEQAITSAGFGRFHYVLLLICGWAVASDSVEVQCVSFVIPTACDLQLTSGEKGWLNAVIFVGMMVGGYAFGGSADLKGRRYMLIWSMAINGVFGLASSFSTSFLVFLFLRFMSGIGVGAAMPVVFSYFTEFLPRHRRGPMIGFLATFWMVGNIVTSSMAWVVIPQVSLGGSIGHLQYGSWRIFVALCAIPSLSSALFIFLMPESPKYLQGAGRYEEAANVFRSIFASNVSTRLPVPQEIDKFAQICLNFAADGADDSFNADTSDADNGQQCMFSLFLGRTYRLAAKILAATWKLFEKPFTSRTFIMLFIWFTLSFGFYGLWMWFPEIFQRIQNGESTCGHAGQAMNVTPSGLTCEEKVAHPEDVYLESFLVALSNLPGNIFTIALINTIGRRQMMALSMTLSGVSVFFFWLVTSKVEMIVMSCVFSGLSVAGWNALDVISMEQYPTHLRSTAFGLQAGMGRIAAILGNAVFGQLVDVHCSVPLLLISALLVAGGLSALRLPKVDQGALH